MKNYLSRGVGRFLLALGVLFHLLVYGWYLYPGTITTRSLVEPDDGYAYIHKANALVKCWRFKNCAAYGALAEQAKEANVTQWFKDRYEGRMFCNYSPLHSVLLLAFRVLAGTWEGAYAALVVSGGLFIAFSFAYLAASIFGLGPAGIFLLLFTSVKYPGAGWQYVVPTNLSAALAALCWTFLIPGNRSRSFRAGAVCAFASVAMHPMGLLLSSLGFLLIFVDGWSKRTIEWAKVLLFGAALLAGKLLLLLFTKSGMECSFGGHLGYDEANFRMAISVLGQWFHQQHGGAIFVITFGALGVFILARELRFAYLVLLAGLAILWLLSGFYVLPVYTGELVMRLLFPFGVFMGISVLAGLVAAAVFAVNTFRANARGWKCITALLFLVVLGINRGEMLREGLLGPKNNWNSLRFWRWITSRPPDFYLDPGSVEVAKANAGPEGVVGTDHETILYHALANGLAGQKVMFYSLYRPGSVPMNADVLLLQSPVQPRWLGDGPVMLKFSQRGKSFPVALEVENRFFYEVPAVVYTGEGRYTIPIPARTRLTLANIQVNPSVSPFVKLDSPEGGGLVLEGVKISEEQKLHWPWDKGLEIKQGKKPVLVETKEITCEHDCSFPKEILSDNGFAVVVKRLKK